MPDIPPQHFARRAGERAVHGALMTFHGLFS